MPKRRAALAFAGVTLGGVLNIVLDPFFILPQYMNMGAVGAGLATAISNTAGTLFFLLCLLRRSSTVLSLRPCHLKRTGVYIREILSIGFPSALQYALTVVSLAVLSLFVSKYAVEAVAAYGIVKKLDNLPLYFSLGTSAGLLPFLSYNYASGDRERQRQGFVFGVSITVGFSLACVIVFELFAPQLARLFIQDDMTVAYAAAFLRRMVLCMPLRGHMPSHDHTVPGDGTHQGIPDLLHPAERLAGYPAAASAGPPIPPVWLRAGAACRRPDLPDRSTGPVPTPTADISCLTRKIHWKGEGAYTSRRAFAPL